MSVRASVYVIDDGQGQVKVGLSQDIRTRLGALASMRRRPLRVAYHTLPLQYAKWVERRAHKILDPNWVPFRSEWFSVSEEQAIAAVQQAVSESVALVGDGFAPLRAVSGRNIPVSFRVDEEFVEAVKELRRESDDPPSKSEVIRKAVLEARDRERRRQSERKRNGQG